MVAEWQFDPSNSTRIHTLHNGLELHLQYYSSGTNFAYFTKDGKVVPMPEEVTITCGGELCKKDSNRGFDTAYPIGTISIYRIMWNNVVIVEMRPPQRPDIVIP